MSYEIPETFLSLSGWYSSGLKTDSEGVQYMVMRFVAEAEYGKNGRRLAPPGEGLSYHEKGENVGEAVVYYHGFNALFNHKAV
jgi:hypothetical protein